MLDSYIKIFRPSEYFYIGIITRGLAKTGLRGYNVQKELPFYAKELDLWCRKVFSVSTEVLFYKDVAPVAQ